MESFLLGLLWFLVGLAVAHWPKILSFALRFVPDAWGWLYTRWRWQQGWMVDGYLGFRLVGIDRSGTLIVNTIGPDTTLKDLYGGSTLAAEMAVKYCYRDQSPVCLEDSRSRKIIQRPMNVRIASIYGAKGALAELARLQRTKKVDLVFGLALVNDGVIFQYRVLVVVRPQLEAMLSLVEDVKTGKVAVDNDEVGKIVHHLQTMACDYKAQMKEDGLKTLGQISVRRVILRRKRLPYHPPSKFDYER